METKIYLAKRIAELRKQRHLQQGELAAMLTPKRGVSTISSWECARTMPDVDSIVSLCDALEVNVSELFPPRNDASDRGRLVDLYERMRCDEY